MRNVLRASCISFIALLALALPLGAQDETLGDILDEDSASKDKGYRLDSYIEVDISQSWMDVNDVEGEQDWGTDGRGPSVDLGAGTRLYFSPPAAPSFEHGPFLDAGASFDMAVKDAVAGNPYMVGDDFSASADSGWRFLLSSAGAARFVMDARLLGGLAIKGFTESDPAYLPLGAVPSDFWFRMQTRVGFDLGLGLRSKRFDMGISERYVALTDQGAAYGLGAVKGFEQSFKAEMDIVMVDGKGWDWSLAFALGSDLDSRIVVPRLGWDFDASMAWGFKDIGDLDLVFLGWDRSSDLPGLDAAAEVGVETQWFGKLRWTAEMPDGSWSLSFRWPYAASLDGADEDGRWELGLGWRSER